MRFTAVFTLIMFVFSLMLQSCATVVNGTSQDVTFSTVPSGATVKIGDQQCVTPCSLSISRRVNKVYFKKDNQEKEYQMERGLNGVPLFLGNILWLLPGLAVDFIAGGAYTIKPVNVSLSELDNVDSSEMTFSKEPASRPLHEAAALPAAQIKSKETPIKRGDSFAVLPFVVLSPDTRFNQLSQGFSENLTYHLVNSQSVKVIERLQMDKALQEMRLGMTGIVDNSTAQAIGKILGAKYVVIGSVEILGDHVEINCRVLQVQTSENILVEKVSGNVDEMFALRDEIGQRISQQVALCAKK